MPNLPRNADKLLVAENRVFLKQLAIGENGLEHEVFLHERERERESREQM